MWATVQTQVGWWLHGLVCSGIYGLRPLALVFWGVTWEKIGAGCQGQDFTLKTDKQEKKATKLYIIIFPSHAGIHNYLVISQSQWFSK